MDILGIDLGSRIVAFGFIDPQKEQSFYSLLKVDTTLSLNNKVYAVFEAILGLFDSLNIDEVAVEDPFYSVNIKSSMILSQMKGAAIVATKLRGARFYDYSPRQIKQAVCGYGGAKKDQVKFIVEHTLKIDLSKEPLDVSDALAIALAHSYMRKK